MVKETVTLERHLIDSDILRRVFDKVVEEGGEFEIVEFRVGRRNDEASFARIDVRAGEPQVLDRILEGLRNLGAATDTGDASFAPAERDEILPDEFYSTTNFDNEVSAEVNKTIAVKGTAREMQRAREAGERIVVVAGPAVVHTGGDFHLARLVHEGWVDVILTGNGLRGHDRVGAREAVEPGHAAGDRPRYRRRVFPRAAGRRVLAGSARALRGSSAMKG